MSHDPYSWISSQNPLQFTRGLRRATGAETHACVNAVAHSDATALMYAHPSCTGGRVQQSVEYRPVSDGITAIKHVFGLSPRRGNASTVEMVPSNPDRSSKLPLRHHLVY